MGHSFVEFRGRHVHMHDHDIAAVVNLLGLAQMTPDLATILRGFMEDVVAGLSGMVELRVDELVCDDVRRDALIIALQSARDRLPAPQTSIETNNWALPPGLVASGYPASRGADSIQAMINLLCGQAESWRDSSTT